MDVSQCLLYLSEPDVALVVAAAVHILILAWEVLKNPVREMLVRVDLLMFTDLVPCSIHRVRPDVKIMSGLAWSCAVFRS